LDALLDASVVLALLLDEPSTEDLSEIVPEGTIASVNAAEVVTKLIAKGASPDQARATVLALGLTVIPFEGDVWIAAGAMRQVDKELSLGDRCCLALAHHLAVPVWTGERLWKQHATALQVDVRLIR
jgi:ribonuclease VapC